ncbi:MAG TPA: ribonuclease E inhibitor RraB [Novosphingobium sp.]|nr:ribonuclease E inhibitor RraB [Novosphingobium sp.]HZV08149.1 ribonuclease E inhibitor RraB [Novosphingobium sp.]
MTLLEENAEILREIAAGGTDLTQEVTLEFAHFFEDEEAAHAFAEAAHGLAFAVEVFEGDEEEEEPWEVAASKVMVPTAEAITAAEQELGALAEKLGGEADGWGFLEEE